LTEKWIQDSNWQAHKKMQNIFGFLDLEFFLKIFNFYDKNSV